MGEAEEALSSPHGCGEPLPLDSYRSRLRVGALLPRSLGRFLSWWLDAGLQPSHSGARHLPTAPLFLCSLVLCPLPLAFCDSYGRHLGVWCPVLGPQLLLRGNEAQPPCSLAYLCLWYRPSILGFYSWLVNQALSFLFFLFFTRLLIVLRGLCVLNCAQPLTRSALFGSRSGTQLFNSPGACRSLHISCCGRIRPIARLV